MDPKKIDSFFKPKSVALIGISRETSRHQNNEIEILREYGYQGRIYPVNPKAEQIFGLKSYAEVDSLPEIPDLAVIRLPREKVPPGIEQCGKKGIRSIIVNSQGFSDAGDSLGSVLQEDIVRTAKKYGCRVLGPNTMGVLNGFDNFSSAFIPYEKSKTPLAMISQSGILIQGYSKGTIVGKGVDLGNCCDLDFADFLEYLGCDEDIKVVNLHIEALKNPSRFFKVARKVGRTRPILVLKTGRSPAGAQASVSHTGSLSGFDDLYEGFFRQSGLIQAKDLEMLDDLNRAFLYLPSMRGNKVAIATVYGAGGVISADACWKAGLDLANLSGKGLERLKGIYPKWMTLGNPIDFGFSIISIGSSVVKKTLQVLLEESDVDGIILVLSAFKPRRQIGEVPEILLEIAEQKNDKPLVVVAYGPWFEELKEQIESRRNMLVFNTAEKACTALSYQLGFNNRLHKDKNGKNEGKMLIKMRP